MRSCRLPTDGICPLPDGRSVESPLNRRRKVGDKTARRKQRKTGNTKQTANIESHVPNRIERRGAKLFGDDFRRGFRSDAFRFALIALFTAAVRLFIGSLSGSVVTYLLFGVYLTLVLPVAAWTLLQNVYYKVSVFGGVRNGVLHYLRSLPVTLLLVLATALPLFAALTFVPIVVRYPLLILFALFGIVPLAMMWLLYASHLFDRTINRETYPEIWRRGLRPLPPDTTSETPAVSDDAPSEGDDADEGNTPDDGNDAGEENDTGEERSD